MEPDSEKKQISYLIRLIDDRDQFVRDSVCDRLIEIGEDTIPFLEIMAKTADPKGKTKALEIIQAIFPKQLQKQFSNLVQNSSPGHWDLEAGVTLLSKFGYPKEDANSISLVLDQLATEASNQIKDKKSPEEAVKALTHFIFVEKEFKGNSENFFDPDNTYFSQMLKHKRGIPITLSALCVFVGQRLGLPIVGVGLPGHYIAKYDSLSQPIYFDPFEKGRILSWADCVKLVERMGYHFEEHYLVTSTNRETLARMMNNLIVIYNKSSQLEKSNHLTNFIKVLSGGPKSSSTIRPN